MWTMEPASERLTITFSTLLPETLPTRSSPTQVLMPLPQEFWAREEIPEATNLNASSLIADIQATDQGLLITMRNDQFGFAAAIEKKTRTVLLDFVDQVPAALAPQPDTAANASSTAAPPEPGPQDNATARPATASSLRGRIDRTTETTRAAPSRVRQPISRAVQHAVTSSENATAVSPVNATTVNSTARDQLKISSIQISPDSPPPEKTAGNQTAAGNATTVHGDANQTADQLTANNTAPAPPREADAGVLTGQADGQDNATTASMNQTDLVAAPSNANNATDSNSTQELELLYDAVQSALEQGDLAAAQRAIRTMLRHPGAPPPLQQDLLYTLADLAWQEGGHDLHANFSTILDAYVRAKNFAPFSDSAPEALLQIANLHLAVGNEPEAKAYFNLLRRRFPQDERVPMVDHYLGEHFMRRQEYSQAADHFQYVIQNHPDSTAAQASTFGLLRAMTELGYFDKAADIAARIEKKWPKFHLETPQYLMTAGYTAMMRGDLDRAREYFWQYVNLVPKAADVDVAMARIGDILVRQGKREAAKEIYHRTAEAHPKSEGGLIALMRLAEEGVLDDPSVGDLDAAFTRPKVDPEEIYTRILKHAQSPLAPVARLKLAMWRLWNKDYPGTLREAGIFEQDYPGHELGPKARDVAFKAAGDWIDSYLANEDYAGILRLWSEQAALFQDRPPLPQTRLAVATAFMKTGDPQNALETASPFVFGPIPQGEYSEAGLDLTLALLVDLKLWPRILELATAVSSWNLSADRQRQVDYAAALAHETLGQHAGARPLWLKLATDMELTDTQRGYAHYFMARGALADGDLERTAILAQEALNLLLKTGDDRPKIMDSLELLIQSAERSDRIQDALAWSLEYDEYLTTDDEAWKGHTYRKALLYKKNNEPDQWRTHLEQLKELFPSSLHGRMAAAELESFRLEKEVGRIR